MVTVICGEELPKNQRASITVPLSLLRAHSHLGARPHDWETTYILRLPRYDGASFKLAVQLMRTGSVNVPFTAKEQSVVDKAGGYEKLSAGKRISYGLPHFDRLIDLFLLRQHFKDFSATTSYKKAVIEALVNSSYGYMWSATTLTRVYESTEMLKKSHALRKLVIDIQAFHEMSNDPLRHRPESWPSQFLRDVAAELQRCAAANKRPQRPVTEDYM